MTDKLEAGMSNLAIRAPIGTRWQHWKGGIYEVVGYCILEETARPAVIYKSNESFLWWARDGNQFLDGRFVEVLTDDQPA